jgi:hypothetical protein
MAEHSRVWSADDPNSPFAEGGAFRFSVTDADELIERASVNFVAEQAKAWQDIRKWADDQIEVMETEAGGSPNGPGSSLSLTQDLRTELPKLWARHNIHSVLDVACGDWNWMRYVDLSGLRNYFGWDIDPELVTRCVARYGEMLTPDGYKDSGGGWPQHYPNAYFEVRNVAESNFPNVDCILARDILIHFPNDYISAILDRMQRGHAKYLLASNFPEDTNDFVYDPTRYVWAGYMEHPVNLELPPFSLSNKVDAIPEAVGPAGVLTSPHELALFKLDPGPGHFPLPVITPA